MTITSSSLENISSSYQPYGQDKAQKNDALGRDAFLTMLVAQLENQDPLNPMDGTDFSAQLAQFSQLEQLITLNESMEKLAQSYADNSEGDLVGYIGKNVTGNVDAINISNGYVTGGFYNLDEPADIMVTITDSDGNTIKTLYEGQQGAGSHVISWDGTDKNGKAAADGSYQYTVLANTGSGYIELPSTITGKVEGVRYNNDTAYLVINGVLIDPSSVIKIEESYATDTGSSSSQSSILEYLGKNISSNTPIVLVEDGAVEGSELGFHLESAQDVSVKIFSLSGETVRTIQISADNTSAGDNSVLWNGVSDSGYQVPDGLYPYMVETASGYASTPVSNEVTGIKYINGTQYLVLEDSGRLVSLASITGIK